MTTPLAPPLPRWIRVIDSITTAIGSRLGWLILISCAASAGNAVFRKLFNMSTNAWLEIQWYLFGVVFMLGAARVLQLNEHVRIDALSGYWSERTRLWVDLLGITLFIWPTVVLFVLFGWPMFWQSWTLQEISADAGGLIRWPIKLMVPLGFAWLGVQSVAEWGKCWLKLQALSDTSTQITPQESAND